MVQIKSFLQFYHLQLLAFPLYLHYIKYTQFLYDFAGDDLSVAIPLNKWIGENYALSGSFYVFFASIIKTLNLNFIILILLISLVEIYSYKRINKGIIKILKIHNKHL